MLLREKLKEIRCHLLGRDPGFLTLYYRLFLRPEKDSWDEILDNRSKGVDQFYFIQIGGNDGFSNDPVYKLARKHNWTGVIVEPQGYVFKYFLSKTYRNRKNIFLENVAISDKEETKPIYKIGVSQSRWATGLTSFDKDMVLKAIKNERVARKAKREGITLPITDPAWIASEEVPCKTIAQLYKKYAFPKLDLLQIDTEGYDYEIIKTINFDEILPQIISFEHIHLTAEDKVSCFVYLEEKGYSIKKFKTDAIAFLE